MGLEKYRSDVSEKQQDGATVWSARWMGGPSLSKIENCRLENLVGDMRATVYIQGEPDTFFSIPAKCCLFGKVVTGYVTSTDGELVFRHCYY
jgi:hypothetical protein